MFKFVFVKFTECLSSIISVRHIYLGILRLRYSQIEQEVKHDRNVWRIPDMRMAPRDGGMADGGWRRCVLVPPVGASGPGVGRRRRSIERCRAWAPAAGAVSSQTLFCPFLPLAADRGKLSVPLWPCSVCERFLVSLDHISDIELDLLADGSFHI